MDQQTATMTQSITNTKLMIATGIMLIAGGLAFAAAPLSSGTPSSCIKNIQLSSPCKSGFQNAQIICKDGYVYNSATSTRTCLSAEKWMSSAETVCKNHCTSTGGGTTTTTTTSSTTGKLFLQMRNNDPEFNNDRIVLAGTSAWVGKLKLRAEGESIIIKDLKLNNGTDISDDVTSICLYRFQTVSAENLISCQSVDSSGIVFYHNINEVVDQGTEYWYIYANINPMSDLPTGTADSHTVLSFYVKKTIGNVVAEGTTSGQTLTLANSLGTVLPGEYAFDFNNNDVYNEIGDESTAKTKQFIISGTKISNVFLPNSYGGYTVDSLLVGSGDYVSAILAITTEDTNNTDAYGNILKTKLNGLRFDFRKSANLSVTKAKIKKIGGIDPSANLSLDGLSNTSSTYFTASASNTAYFLPNDYKLNPRETAYFVITLEVGQTTSSDWIQFVMNDIKGTYNTDDDNNIDWNDGYSPIKYNALLLDMTSLTGNKISAQ